MSGATNSFGERIVRCPACGQDSVYAASNPYRPNFLGSSCYRGQNTTAPDYILRP